MASHESLISLWSCIVISISREIPEFFYVPWTQMVTRLFSHGIIKISWKLKIILLSQVIILNYSIIYPNALEIFRQTIRDMNANLKRIWTHLCSIHKNGLCSCCCQTKPNASSAILSVFAVEFPRKNQTQNRSMICIWRRPNSYYCGSSILIGLGSLCTHWYDITDLYQDII
jgi:hypothetical protein